MSVNIVNHTVVRKQNLKDYIKTYIDMMKKKKYIKIVKNQAAVCGKRLLVNNYSLVSSGTYIGDFVNFNGIKIIGKGNVYVGNYFHSGYDCVIMTDNHNYEGEKIPYDETDIVKDVYIGDFVWFGIKVTVLPGVHIGEGAIIQAGAVVVNDIPDFAIAGGNPAKVFKYRNIDHFRKLKEEGKFH